jgi:hypothetical protein
MRGGSTVRDRLLGRTQSEPESPPAPGVIDTIGLGFSQLLARPHVVALPVLVDLYLWLGLRAPAQPLTTTVAGWVQQRGSIGADTAEALEGLQSFNLFELISLRLPVVRLPTLIPLVAEPSNLVPDGWNIEIGSLPWWSLPGIGLVLIAIGFFVGGTYLCLMSAVAAGQRPAFVWKEWLRIARDLAIWTVVAALLLALVVLPLIVAQAVFLVYELGMSSLLLFLMLFPVAWGFIMFFFSAQAIVIDGVTAMQSFRSSYQVVRRYLGQSAGFIAAYLLVTSGFPLLWRLLLTQPAGVVIAIIGNAFIVSGMISAAMLFYRDRAQLLVPVAER